MSELQDGPGGVSEPWDGGEPDSDDVPGRAADIVHSLPNDKSGPLHGAMLRKGSVRRVDEGADADEQIPDDDAVAWIWQRIVLTGFKKDMWREEHGFIVADFLASPTITRLTVFIDAQGRIAMYTDSNAQLSSIVQIQYFVKPFGTVALSKGDVKEHIQYGIVSGNILNNIFHMMSNVFAPTFLGNTSWPTSVRKEFSGHVHKFMASLTETVNHSKGSTILYLPHEDLSDIEAAIADKDLVQRLESTLIHWTRQIKEVVTNQETSHHVEEHGPIEEIEFWRSRTVDLLGIRKQLDRQGLTDIIRVLEAVGSTYLRQFEILKGMIQSGSQEADDNLRYLETLAEPCNKLRTSAPSKISPLFPEILNLIRNIWSNSKYYNTNERLTGLLRKVSSQIIRQCTGAIDLLEIFNGDADVSMLHLRESINCGVEWRSVYEINAEEVRKTNPKAWSVDPSSIFAQIEAFVQRCRELLEVCEGQVQFARKSSLSPTGKIELPVFGGSRGQEVEKAMYDIEDAFEKHIERLRSLDYNILDVKATNWHDDYNFFKNGIKDLEVMMTNVISSAFDSASTVASGVELLESFASVAKRPSMKTVLNRKTADVFSMLKADILAVKRDFDHHHSQPPLPPCQPRFAGRALWARGLSRRCLSHRAIVNRAACLVNDNSRECRDAYLALDQVVSVLEVYQKQMHSEFVDYVDEMNTLIPFAQRFEQPLLRLSSSATEQSGNHLEANFDEVILRVFDEVSYWNQFSGSEYTVPYAAHEIAGLHDPMRTLYQNIMLVVREYNAVVDALTSDERQLFADHMRKVDRRLNPGLTKLTWSKRHVKEFFVKVCRDQCRDVSALISAFHGHHQSIMSNCKKIAATSVIAIEKNIVYTDTMFKEAQSRHRAAVEVELAEVHQDIVSRMNQCYEVFKDAPSDVQRSWASYIRRIDRHVESALRQMVKRSMMELSKAIAGDAKKETQALFKVAMVLDEGPAAQTSTVAFRPNMSDLTNLVNDISRKLMNTVKVIPRLTDILEYKRKKKNAVVVTINGDGPGTSSTTSQSTQPAVQQPEWNPSQDIESTTILPSDAANDSPNFYDAIANDEDVLKTFVAIIQGMRNVTTDISELVAYWKDAYRSAWDLDKDAYMRRYANTKRPFSSYDMDITRYRSMQEDIQSEDPIRTVRFIKIDCALLKSALVSHCIDWQNRLTSLLHANSLAELQTLHELISSTSEQLLHEPTDLNQLGTGLNLLAKMKKEISLIDARFDPVDDMFRTLTKFGVTLSDEEKEMLDDLRPSWATFLTTMRTADVMLTQVKNSMKRGLEMSLDTFNETVADSRRLFQGSDVFKATAAADETAGFETALILVESWKKKVSDFRSQAAAMKAGLDIFGIVQPVYKDLEDTERDLQLLDTIWQLTAEWESYWQGCRNGVFRDLNSDDMDLKATDIQNRVVKLAKTMKKWPVWNALRENIERFRVMMPLVKDLKNPAMRERHWQELKDEVQDSQFEPDSETFTLGKLFELGVHQHAETISALSAIASREFSIEETLADIAEKWRIMIIDIAVYKEGRYRRIVSTDDLFQTLEDNHVSLSSMKNSPHYITFEESINLWIRRLNEISECIEVVLAVQRQWMYLESIFVGSEDIRKQLPVESALFENVNGSWIEIMDRWDSVKVVLACVEHEGQIDRLQRMKATLEKIQKSLDQYLEKKRQIFPRFYFLSDDDLLEVLGQTRDPSQVQKHVKKCFAAIHRLEMQSRDREGASNTVVKAWDVIGMIAEDGEHVRFLYGIAAQGPVELWLIKVEKSMRETLRKHMQEAVITVQKSMSKRENWIRSTIGQLLITSGQVAWTMECTKALQDPLKARKALKQLRNKWYRYLERLTVLIRGDLSSVDRLKLVALITIEVHARDVLEKMLKHGVTSTNEFQWTSQLRFYYDKSEGDYGECQVRQTTTTFAYGYEYQGNNGRLVVTPLTDRCYLTLTTALHLHLGGSPQGPAGTGKTETVKDLGKALGNFVIVFNCSDAMDYKSLATLYSGLAQTGAWGCFDEFNRILIEVLSVIAQQIASIFHAVSENKEYFSFEGVQIKLNRSVGIFITMNPGYAGRTELPDNLKSLFRPVAMMVPDFALIAEIMLQAEGFKEARPMARKIVTLYNLMEQQLSKQEHYDFGLRAVKSVLNRAGAISRETQDANEEVVLNRALRDMNIPKFVAEDTKLFNGLMLDLFPGLDAPVFNQKSLEDAIKEELVLESLQPSPALIYKILQLYESKRTRHGNMVVGETLSGKTTAWKILQHTLTSLSSRNEPGFKKVETFIINPKTVDNNELYGSYDLNTREWSDGIIASILRKCCSSESDSEKWIVLDGPVDTLWIESMNTVLDDNKILTLINGDRIALTPTISLLFEVQNLCQASPATVSRAGMVYFDKDGIGWQPFITSWVNRKDPDQSELLQTLFKTIVAPLLQFKSTSDLRELVSITDFNAVQSLTRLYDALAVPSNGVELPSPSNAGAEFSNSSRARMIESWLLFSCVWSVGAALDDAGRLRIDEWLREMEASFPGLNTVYDYVVDGAKKDWVTWEERMPNSWSPPPNVPMYSLVVPTVDTVRNGFLGTTLLSTKHPVLFVGGTGTGKTVLAHSLLSAVDGSRTLTMTLNFSSVTSSLITQSMLESRMEKRQRNSFGPLNGRTKLVVFVDDLNMPTPDAFGSQPPNELLRQYIDWGGWYDRSKQTLKVILDMQVFGAMGQPGGGRSVISSRLQSRFNLINIPFPSDLQIRRIFGVVIASKLSTFDEQVKPLASICTDATLDLYKKVVDTFLPIPSKPHYMFNLRDMTKVTEGLLRADQNLFDTRESIIRLWVHECMRVFHDRLINLADRTMFKSLVSQQLDTLFATSWGNLFGTSEEDPLFGTFLSESLLDEQNSNTYQEMPDRSAVKTFVSEKLEFYNMFPGNAAMNLVLFDDAVEHITRIFRIISQPRGNALLIGVGGSGRQSLTRLAAYIAEVPVVQVETTQSYRPIDFREDLKALYQSAGVSGQRSVFLMTDTQLVHPSFLEDINNMLTSGEIPNLFPPEELSPILEALRPQLSDNAKYQTDDGLYSYFVELVRQRVNVVLCMSPVGSAFRDRVRMYPALVNNTTIDYFGPWPEKALQEVASKFLGDVDLSYSGNDAAVQKQLAGIFCTAHLSVQDSANQMAQELLRFTYVTPTNYLDLVTGYRRLLIDKRASLCESADKLRNGLSKLDESRKQVAEMTVELEEKRKIVALKKNDCEKLLVEIVSQQRAADEQRKQVEIEAAKTSTEEKECQSIAGSAQSDLEKAMPALERAVAALDRLDKTAITEVKSYTKPPPIVARVMSAVMVVMGKEASWTTAKKELSDANFLLRLKTFDKDNIPSATLKKISKFTAAKDFTADNVSKKSLAAGAMCDWVIAMEIYALTFRTVAPKRAALKEAMGSLEIKQKQLRVMQEKLTKVKEQVAALEARYESSDQEKSVLRKAAESLETKLSRADKLVSGLGSERSRWQSSITQLDEQLSYLVGDCAIAAGFVSYCGPFVGKYRTGLVKKWLESTHEAKVACSPDFNAATFLASPTDIRDWKIQGLPSDDFSIENGLLVTRGLRWPLMVDPQGQANKWAKALHGKTLKVVDPKDKDLSRTMESCIQFGIPVLMQDVGEKIDPGLDPILLKQIIIENGRRFVRLGDKKVEYNDSFLFWMTTRLQNPHYAPEVCAKCTIVNFAVKEKGLEEQLLAFVVKIEQPKLEEDKSALVITVANNKRKLVELENEILSLLKTASGSLVDDEGLINTLQASKRTSEAVSEDLRVSEETEKQIDSARESYRPCAVRSAILFFVLNDLASIDPMYQFSLDAYFELFRLSIDKSRKPKGTIDVKERVRSLNTFHTDAVYKYTCRGLFEKHKLLLSFQMCIRKMSAEGKINNDEFLFLLRGGLSAPASESTNPAPDWISNYSWDQVQALNEFSPLFNNLSSSLEQNHRGWKQWARAECPETAPFPGEWQAKLDDLQRMILLKIFRPDRVIHSARRFVSKNLGPSFVEPPPMDLAQVFADSNSTTPIVFVLSPGVDPTAMLRSLAVQADRQVEEISLGQGQEAPAQRLLAAGIARGFWVFFANCHLSISWMPELESLIDSYCSGEVHPNFRLWLSSDPHPKFPISILQRSIKITTEPPRGLRANLLRLYTGLKQDSTNTSLVSIKYKRLVLSLCWFHSVLLERRKFGSLGWNVAYGFNDSDFSVCELILKLYLDDYDTPWEGLKYLIADANYGGRVTDDRDRKLLNVYVDQFINESVLNEKNFRFSGLDTYYIPDDGQDIVAYLKSLPSGSDHPEAFGQHPNADINAQMGETTCLLSALLSLQPRTETASGQSREQAMLILTEQLLQQIPALLPVDSIPDSTGDESTAPLRTVLLQEVHRYNVLLAKIRSLLVNLQKGITGLVVISPALEQVYDAIFLGNVPDSWHSAYPSVKALGPWTKDLCRRHEQMTRWIAEGPPKTFWLAGLTFPTGLLTALLQCTARKNNVAIDDLSWEFIPLSSDEATLNTSPKDGAYISGLYLEGARWDFTSMSLADALPMELEARMPVVHFKPVDNKRGRSSKGLYACPLYMYPIRTGTRERPSFMINVDLKTGSKDPSFWCKRGAALLLSLAT